MYYDLRYFLYSIFRYTIISKLIKERPTILQSSILENSYYLSEIIYICKQIDAQICSPFCCCCFLFFWIIFA